MKKSNFLLYILAGVLGILVFIFFLVMFNDNAACFLGKSFGIKTSTESKKETLQFLGWIISGFITFFGLFVFNKRAAALDKANELTEKGHVQDRFKAAVDHLSNKDSVSGRTASFYELSNLAKDNKDTKDNYAQTILDILCAHLRYVKNENIDQELTESQILIDMLFSQKEENPFSSLYYDFRRAKLPYVDFKKTQKPEGKVDFGAADLHKTVFDEADLSGFRFQRAVLHDAKFRQTNLQEVDLSESDLLKANLSNADLRGADLSDTKNLETATLSGAKYGKSINGKDTIFPEGFDPKKHGMKLLP